MSPNWCWRAGADAWGCADGAVAEVWEAEEAAQSLTLKLEKRSAVSEKTMPLLLLRASLSLLRGEAAATVACRCARRVVADADDDEKLLLLMLIMPAALSLSLTMIRSCYCWICSRSAIAVAVAVAEKKLLLLQMYTQRSRWS
jgi:hypothetical protein